MSDILDVRERNRRESYEATLQLRSMRLRIERETGQRIDELHVNAASVLDDVVQALELRDAEAALVLGKAAYATLNSPISANVEE